LASIRSTPLSAEALLVDALDERVVARGESAAGGRVYKAPPFVRSGASRRRKEPA
jgi:hypothetical protein